MTTDTTLLKSKTLKELRALAKARSLKGYSKLTKEQLLRLLARPAPQSSTTTSRTKKARAQKPAATTAAEATPEQAVPVTSETKPSPVPTAEAPPAASPEAVQFAATEEWVERTKYASRPNGGAVFESGPDLGEDIDRLPTLKEPMVCLLSQKPGVLYAYWVLPPDDAGEHVDYKLRLCRIEGGSVNLREEIPVQGPHGGWYFHVPESDDSIGTQIQLGYYRDGQFVSARGRSIAQLPSLYASTRTDERWWVSEADFMRMYLRAGGFVAPGDRYAWNASIGSPGGGPSAPGEHLAWPGGVSSQLNSQLK
jgi:hypothetical protein